MVVRARPGPARPRARDIGTRKRGQPARGERVLGEQPKGGPDLVVDVDRDRVVDPALGDRASHAVDVVLEGNSGVWPPMTTSPSRPATTRGSTALRAAS